MLDSLAGHENLWPVQFVEKCSQSLQKTSFTAIKKRKYSWKHFVLVFFGYLLLYHFEVFRSILWRMSIFSKGQPFRWILNAKLPLLTCSPAQL